MKYLMCTEFRTIILYGSALDRLVGRTHKLLYITTAKISFAQQINMPF